ncbi:MULTISPECIES: bifunctional tRNA (5-methylaminomethyl-2-thiouridine)(34)-methyltransferase MnmD/FAD-dependent 5-carboxymethylaminomethyl-2-thiouridine(34) oxidoreductase MnmC [Legionella]|uniref:tRNA 5-methylaminomethyl-2-thiouridine biosynthesis bifunctional protein MnmC n=1 Tax=Legionella septentrionalis TaxID=2498109 RepID=A0A3S0VMN3_9GAMM|nr:bifunctional tRNA (5-methylaminomethyl-2-thiouridine)(34)-methyltransferase MnmD/FAD-dependent 5-carboxymethylaminomethyl-2-thiouridine(34) oxidoreductase MnmC [Legionella septentrionalis]MCP0913418.1 bifunctional tRNA (5-methylaminomethyl-2-thiouridine)(34)-methyltransferase MnmD/FAD-dependent 5-carboxymethylaminomethyl-2-thiouridine(34) oxidoreductase MnmC [Legionella sp. 27cVA30]RUQ84940.1 bifunctional tRNA (5-methylaminomethyl-2-thiouridine)(34)-methyltransferase MnmD/FAD-dependent 5-carbo
MSSFFQPIQTAKLIWREGLPYSAVFNDIYFSTENGLQETQHVFIEGNQLLSRWAELANCKATHFIVAETGFGSGLNFLLTWFLWKKYAPPLARLHFISCEKYPLTYEDLAKCLALWPELNDEASSLLKSYPVLTPGFHLLSFDENRVQLTLMLGDALACYQQLLVCGDKSLEMKLRTAYVDAWFLDGFAPAKNPNMWDAELLKIIALLSRSHTTLATFSAAGAVKRGLESVGFTVKKKGGYGRKREMVTAVFQGKAAESSKRHTPWQASAPLFYKEKRAIILGAGLAGCCIAYALRRRGWSITILDACGEAGQGASGNQYAVLYPKLSAYRSPLTEFMLSAFLHAIRFYQQLLQTCSFGELNGILQLAYNDKEIAMQQSLQEWLAHYPALGTLVAKNEAEHLAGLALKTGGLFIPNSGWIHAGVLCRHLLQLAEVHEIEPIRVKELQFAEGKWHAEGHSAEVLVLANGYQARQFAEIAYLPLKAIRGQMSTILSNEETAKLKLPLCGNGHVLPANQGKHGIGATYHLDNTDIGNYAVDDAANLKKLSQLTLADVWSRRVIKHWSGIRAATPDYLPLVGPVMQANLFKEQFADFATNAKRWLPAPGPSYPGLYICAGFGSRGLTTIPLSAEWLASLINHEPESLPRHLIQAISPARFLYRELSRNRNKT